MSNADALLQKKYGYAISTIHSFKKLDYKAAASTDDTPNSRRN